MNSRVLCYKGTRAELNSDLILGQKNPDQPRAMKFQVLDYQQAKDTHEPLTPIKSYCVFYAFDQASSELLVLANCRTGEINVAYGGNVDEPRWDPQIPGEPPAEQEDGTCLITEEQLAAICFNLINVQIVKDLGDEACKFLSGDSQMISFACTVGDASVDSVNQGCLSIIHFAHMTHAELIKLLGIARGYPGQIYGLHLCSFSISQIGTIADIRKDLLQQVSSLHSSEGELSRLSAAMVNNLVVNTIDKVVSGLSWHDIVKLTTD